ncbi:MAG: hypothetical protein ABMA13_14500 [Chthoniobacteraceae bacterium]
MKRWLAVAALHAVALGGDFEPRGRVHIPIGIPDTRDTLKTFVEAEGNFSPGFATCGVAFWIHDPDARRFFAPTMDDVPHTRGLSAPGVLIPWTEWKAGAIAVRSEVCQVQRGDAQVVGARVRLTNTSSEEKRVSLFAAVTALGATGAPLTEVRVEGDTIFANREPMLISAVKPDGGEAPAPAADETPLAIAKLPPDPSITMKNGEASGALRFEVVLAPGETKTFGFVCPVLHGRRAAPHLWDGVSPWVQLDEADPISGSQGAQQPSPGVDFYRAIKPDDLFAEAGEYWRKFRGDVEIELPDVRWSEAFHAITTHAAMCLNEGAPDLAVINSNVSTRGGVQLADVFQKCGNFPLSRKLIDYFLRHPFSGRVEPEADSPGQVLWLVGEHWRFTRDHEWLREVWPRVERLAALIEYCRTAPEPHWISASGIGFGDHLPEADRMRLIPGACDGQHPEYTGAFDLAGLRAAAMLAEEMNDNATRERLTTLIARLAHEYDTRFLADLRSHEYADYCVLWPCRLYPLGGDLFGAVGAQAPKPRRYFPLMLAHQGLLAGNRDAAHGTIAKHFDLDSMIGWYALDEGGPGGAGIWESAKTRWPVETNGPNGALSSFAMPHGWAIAELHLLLRDALVFEDGDKLVLFAGIPPGWFAKPMRLRNVPTHLGKLDVEWMPSGERAELRISGIGPRTVVVLRLPWADETVADGLATIPLR